jgi:hypothetical protein
VQKDASPLNHIKYVPVPFLLMNAEIDHWLQEDAKKLKHLLEVEKVPVSHHVMKGKNHRTVVRHLGKTKLDHMTPLISDFIEKHSA